MAIHETVKFDGDRLPAWDEHTGTYLDPDTGEVLPTWDQALDAIGDQDEPLHVARFGARFDAQGVLAGSTRRQPVHRLPDQVPDQAPRRLPPGRHRRPGRARRPARRCTALRAVLADLCELAPLRHPAQERQAGHAAGRCKGKAHRREYLGYAGRRVLVSRRWSGKTLADHRADRKTWLTQSLGLPATDPARYAWEPVRPGDTDHMPQRPAAPARRRRPHPLATALEPKPRRRAAERSFGKRTGRHDRQAAEVHAGDPFAGLPLLIPVPRAAKLLGISRAAAYRFASAGELPTKRLGRRVYVVSAKLREFIETEDKAA